VVGTLCAEGAEHQPPNWAPAPKHDYHFCKKIPNTSPLPLTALECHTKNLHQTKFLPYTSHYCIARYPETGAPKLSIMCGLVPTLYAYFLSFFWLMHSLSEVLSACKTFHWRVTLSPRYGEKRGLLKAYIFTTFRHFPTFQPVMWLLTVNFTQVVSWM